MISTMTDSAGRCTGYLLRPNACPSPRVVLCAFAIAGGALVGEGIAFAVISAFPVSFFLLLTLAALGVALGCGYRDTQRREVIRLSEAEIAIERGHHHMRSRHPFQRGWAQIVVVPGNRAGKRDRLALRSHGRQIEFGDFLDERERRELAGQLRRLVGPNARLE